jgi:anti-sigma regulatory factor (Ser/Thr protein kinase)
MADEPKLTDDRVAPPPRREWRVPATPGNVPRARRAVREFGEAHGAGDDALGNLALAVTEAVTNAVLHAFVERPSGEIVIVAAAEPGELVVSVLDDGRGMQPRPDSPGLGMGLPMIGQLTTSVDIRERAGGGTEVRMRFSAPGVTTGTTVSDEERAELLEAVARLADTGGPPGGLVELLVPALADACAIDRVAAGGLERVAQAGTPAPALGALPAGEGVQLVDATPEPGGDGPAFWVVVPLHDGERPLGLLRLGLDTDRGRPATQDLVFFEALGARAGGCLAAGAELADLGRTRRRVEGILDALAEAVTVNDEQGRTVWANEAAARMLGAASVDEVITSRPGELAGRFHMTREDGTPVELDDLPGRRLLAGLDAPPLLTRSVVRRTGEERFLLTKATLLDEDGERLAVNIIEDVTDVRRAEGRTRFLAHTGEVLGRSLDDPEATLRDIAALIVPELADWCAVDLLDADGVLRRVTLLHPDPERMAFAQEMERLYPRETGGATDALIAGGSSVLIPEVTEDMLIARARDGRHLELLREAGLRSAMLLPLRAGERTTGVLTLVTAESGRVFRPEDVEFGEDVGRRIGMAVENARRYAAQHPDA